MNQTKAAEASIGLFSRDRKLAIALASVLTPDFSIVQIHATDDVSEDVHALLLDLDSIEFRSNGTENLFNRLCADGIPVIVLASYENRAEATRFLKRGAHGYVRTPPVVPTLKTLLRNTIETVKLRKELDAA